MLHVKKQTDAKGEGGTNINVCPGSYKRLTYPYEM